MNVKDLKQNALKIALLAIATITCNKVQGADLAPSAMTVDMGSYSGSAKNLAASLEGKIVNLYSSGSGNLQATFTFAAINTQVPNVIRARFKQNDFTDVFTLQMRIASGAWVNIGTTSTKKGFNDLRFSVPASAVFAGKSYVRIKAGPNVGDSRLDSLLISNNGIQPSPTPTATPGPTPNPTPNPTPVPTPNPTPQPSPTPNPPGTLKLLPGTTWYWQLSGSLNTNVNASVYDVDLFDTSDANIATLKQKGRIVICYFSAGSYENWRSDAGKFPAASLGKNLDGWPGEKWLDIRSGDVRRIMAERMDYAKSRGCDGLEPDNVDGYSNGSGFPLTKQDQISYNSFLADAAHARGMIVALKNSTDLVTSLVNKFDFAVVEECFKYNECGEYSPFAAQNKAVLNAEYTNYSANICSQASALKFSTAFFNLDLNGGVYRPCP